MIQRFVLPTEFAMGATNAYVVGGTDALLIDPATRDPDLDAAVSETVEHVAVTHHHPDHIGAVANYANEWDLTVWAFSPYRSSFEAATGVRPDRTFSPGEILPIADGISILDTPGHAREHVSFVSPDGIVSGDLVLAEGSVVVGAPQGDMRAYLTSLRRLYGRDSDRLYPGHGAVIDTPRSACERLLRHRRRREQRVLAAIQRGHDTPAAIVSAVYEKDISDVYELARATVIAHIEKLAVEGRVSFDGNRVVPADTARTH